MTRTYASEVTRQGALFIVLLAGCSGTPDPAVQYAPAPPDRLFDPLAYEQPAAPRLAFESETDGLHSQFLQQGPVAVHLLGRSGEHPRLIAAFPAGNAAIGVWFRSAEPEARLGSLSDVTALTRLGGGEHPLHGARGTLRSTASRLTSELVLLGSTRALRDYEAGVCLEDAARYPELRNETFELGPERMALRIRRAEIGGEHSLELLLRGLSGTTITLRQGGASSRSACGGSPTGQPEIVFVREGGVELELTVLASDEPLTPIPSAELLTRPPADNTALSALAFLSYREKWLAGSWRFLTYFGRDTLLSLWMLAPAVGADAADDALAAVLERISLEPGASGPDIGPIEPGDVAHEEEIGDYAAWKNQMLASPPAELRTPRYDYKMIDDDFLLAPVLVAVVEGAAAGSSAPPPRLSALLARQRADGRSFEAALLANLELVLRRARPFAEDPRAPADKKELLVGLRQNLSVGEWRDSEMGLGFGRYPFDVNAALVPAALGAASTLYAWLGRPDESAAAARLVRAWQGVEELFRFELPLDTARANVDGYAAALGLNSASASLVADDAGRIAEYALALDASGAPVEVVHSDHSFSLAFGTPSEPYLRSVAELLVRPFPAGLMSPVGVMVANPAFAAPDRVVIGPKSPDDPNDDVSTPLRELFSAAHYHGTVVWSWQQALLAAGLRRQLGRGDLGADTRRLLEQAECELWEVIEATRAQGSSELWSWAARDGQPALRPFGAGAADADEANAIQLWSSVYLAVRPPDAMTNACAPAAAQ